jgi:hypothetical protein
MSIEIITNNYFSNKSDLDFGIDTTDQSIHHVDDIVLSQNDIPNPFYIGFEGGNLMKQERKVMYEFKNVIVLTSNGLSEEFIDKFFSRVINVEQLKQFPQDSVSYERVSIDILKNSKHYFKSNIVTDNDLKLLFPNETFNPREIVLSIFELTKDDANKYLSFYKSQTEINSIKYTLDLVNNYKGNSLRGVSANISQYISNLIGNDFWSNAKNCKLNITNMFTVRDFQSRTSNNSNFILLAQSPEKEKKATPEGDSNYPVKMRNDMFCDISTILKQNKNKDRTFYATIPDNLFIDKDVMDLMNSIENEKQLYDLTNNMLISKDYAHLLFTQDILTKYGYLFKKYPGAYKYSIGYAMLTMYLEECLYITRSTKNSRFVFDINTANCLPTFPFLVNDLKQNPYVSIMIHNEQLDLNKNCVGIKYIQNYDGYGVCDIATFQRRLNIFISGTPELDVFTGVNWNEFAVSGSVIPACLQKRNPLYDAYIHQFKSEDPNHINVAFKHFVNNYYGNSDIDVMCNEQSYIKFILKAFDLYKIIIKNTESNDSEHSFDTVRTVGITLSKAFFEETINDFNNRYGVNWTVEQYIENAKDIRVRMYLHSKYYEFKVKSNESLFRNGQDVTNTFLNVFMQPLTTDQLTIYYAQNEEYDFTNKTKETDFVLYQNDFRSLNNQTKDNKAIMKIGESIRFKLTFKKLNKTFEVFKTIGNDFFSTVARFHLPCVRAYYHNNNVYILPSCIGAMMTGVNIDYKYFAGIRDPYQIVVKYMTRGFGVLLNKDELKQLDTYLTKNNLTKEYFGPKQVYSQTFTQFENKKEYKYIENHDELDKYYKQTNKVIDSLQFNAVANNGNINTCLKSFFDFYYETCK